MIAKMHEESWLRTDAANERGKRVPLFGGCIAKGLQARSGAYITQGETICDLNLTATWACIPFASIKMLKGTCYVVLRLYNLYDSSQILVLDSLEY